MIVASGAESLGVHGALWCNREPQVASRSRLRMSPFRVMGRLKSWTAWRCVHRPLNQRFGRSTRARRRSSIPADSRSAQRRSSATSATRSCGATPGHGQATVASPCWTNIRLKCFQKTAEFSAQNESLLVRLTSGSQLNSSQWREPTRLFAGAADMSPSSSHSIATLGNPADVDFGANPYCPPLDLPVEAYSVAERCGWPIAESVAQYLDPAAGDHASDCRHRCDSLRPAVGRA